MDLDSYLDSDSIVASDKLSGNTVIDSENNESDAIESLAATSKVRKNKYLKDAGQSPMNSLRKCTSQIKKPPHRISSPLNWFPRKKADSYLNRKIKLLQEVGGMNLTLDETLGDSNPHYSRVLKEKIAAREAACKAMEVRKAALVEASWCRILQAARIVSNEAEGQLCKAEESATEAFEAAAAMGVIMYDVPNCSRKPCQIETSSENGRGSTTHTVAASFETAFDVDKEVAAAVKTAFTRLADCPSFDKDEFKDLLRKISMNPDSDFLEFPEVSSECEAEPVCQLKKITQPDAFSSQDLHCKTKTETRHKRYKKRQSPEKLNVTRLVDMFLERLRCLQEDELSSLFTIVATCGLNAALAEENSKQLHGPSSIPAVNLPRRLSTYGVKNSNLEHFMNVQMRRKQSKSEIPSLDKFLVKHMSKLEKEVQEAKNARKNKLEGTGEEEKRDGTTGISSEIVPDLGNILVKHGSKFEREIEEAKKNSGNTFEMNHKNLCRDRSLCEATPSLESMLIKHSSKLERDIVEAKRNQDGKEFGRIPTEVNRRKEDTPDIISLDKCLVKHVSKFEKDVQEARNRRKNNPTESTSANPKIDHTYALANQTGDNSNTCSDGDGVDKENIDLNNDISTDLTTKKKECISNLGALEAEDSPEKILIKASALANDYGNPKVKDKQIGNSCSEGDSLDKILVKHVSRLEREKMMVTSEQQQILRLERSDASKHSQLNEGGLDQILVKHKSRLEREKAATTQSEEHIKSYVFRREMRDRELKEAWEGLSLGNEMHSETKAGALDKVLVKHKSNMANCQHPEHQNKPNKSRKEARERELQEAWGGLSLGNSMKPHQSKLEQDKAAWIKAEEEERKQDPVKAEWS